ncbi:hypothetical protein BATDEDRAFT_86386 [Batrachochytrium dendrobatidis JAM81]|uniref:t-SNARE coiled-coil homology domain-containing protein n=2 Tax=Batrachochytrium dendrobatidis TaxID=109871 RepID=F4NWU6_BATDJ|nr:uncharacterized protein BATDEDRAFT_86386 [Batrachochytrium dendrobatidis JAM81]EGF82882.1 hypothetical protein BATDEDRAFT_86386 [Batrachochytrium dendrobatidis JAM81]KAJ8327902.1 protein transport protein bet1 [Batrachochytrium dendrobatidis]KAK5667154.1 protein transport protein bet1 [Batrachochytrium dendrobatidis]OAJ39409.1 hypothetical protein BDEG_23258 [Batrachochytrium dendrobatidis JEL423]|eukprot:XP_006677084.1 hypothetical protein BATDEDRAFT_86386 [Batrachochytrium dendrobatidis JAM81]
MSRRPYPVGPGVSTGVYDDENDGRATALAKQIGALKQVSLDISDELIYQQNLMDDMHNDFEKTGGILGQTMRRLKIMARSQTGGWMWMMMLFVFGVIFYIYWFRLK